MINTLIVDDSALVRDILRDFLEGDPAFNIIDEAADGEEGVEKILSLNPDLVTLDIEMPKMNGFQVLDAVAGKTTVPIVVITSLSAAKAAYEATLKGALEFYSKDTFTASLSPEKRQAVYESLKRISRVKIQKSFSVIDIPAAAAEGAAMEATVKPFGAKTVENREVHAVVIASSTGGPKALSEFFTLLSPDFPVPIAIVQHNSSGFDKSFAQWLDTYTPLNVKVAEEGEEFKAGTVYISQTDRHLVLKSSDRRNCFLAYNDGEPEGNQKPAADMLFRTAAEALGRSLISVVLTGMGSDGASGTQSVHKTGGITIAQDEDSSLIYGMPKATAETGCVDIVLPLDRIPAELDRLVRA